MEGRGAAGPGGGQLFSKYKGQGETSGFSLALRDGPRREARAGSTDTPRAPETRPWKEWSGEGGREKGRV